MSSSVIRRTVRSLALVLGLAAASRVMAQGGTVEGRITDSAGTALSGVTITVDQSPIHATSSAAGKYQLAGLPAGTHTIRARVIRFVPASASVVVIGDKVVEQNFTLAHTVTQLAPVDVMVGSHGAHATPTDLAVPVDVYGSAVIAQQGTTETGAILANLSPSINFPTQSATDANDIVRPFTLRGLSPDHTLVLVNGWRQHQTALLNTFPYGSAAGSSGVDLNAIPGSAIERVEVLRDGASSQYGSDAIAGVVNIVMRDGVFNPFLNAAGGIYVTGNGYPNDGQSVDLNGGVGLEVGRGSLGLFAEYQHVSPTNRAWADPYLQNANSPPDSVDPNNGQIVQKNNAITQPNLHWGDGLEDDAMFFANFRLPVGMTGSSEIYGFGGYSHRVGTGNGYYRYWDSNRNWAEIYPNGFLPEFHPVVDDYSLTGGVRTNFGGWAADLGLAYGYNAFHYLLRNTLNPSLGPSLVTPTAPFPDGGAHIPNQLGFDAGQLQRGEFQAGATLTRSLNMGMKAPVNTAIGALFRSESYDIVQGEYASWVNGGADAQDGSGPAPAGSSVFGGFAPTDAGNYSRTNIGLFADLESDLSEHWYMNAALRYENYSDFGNQVSWKLAAKWTPQPRFMVRGAVSTGFRAPGLPQNFFSHTTTNYIGGQLVEIGNYPVTNPAAQLFGAQPLKDETSLNLSAGFAYTPKDNFTFSVDAFWIKITNRILLGATFDASDTVVARILSDAGYNNIGGVQFFINGLDTKTSGIDFAGNWIVPAGRGSWNFNLAMNWTQNVITRVAPLPAVLQGTATTYTSSIDLVTTLAITKERPDWRGIFTATYVQGRFHGLGRISYYGQFSSAEPSFTDSATYPPRTLVDAEVGYQFSNVDLTFGARNLFNIYPGRMYAANNNDGGPFPWAAASPFGYNGRNLYLRASMQLLR